MTEGLYIIVCNQCMVGSSILPVCIHQKKLMFLFGKENSWADTPGWSDFGGGVEKGESVYAAALREGAEELSGFLGDSAALKRRVKRHYKLESTADYHVHLFTIPYSADLPALYNANHAFLWSRLDRKYMHRSKVFEKCEIRWFSEQELISKRNQFRPFYRELVDLLVANLEPIRRFATPRSSSTKRTAKRA